MPQPLGRAQRYMPGLDGVRALAVAAVIAYHLGVPWLPGGLLGVGVFFTLSGYLITDLLLAVWESSGRLQLRSFWARRARRLLPALFVMLVVVTTWAAVAQPSHLGELRGEVLAAGLYVSNWWAALAHVSYFARFGAPSPLGHLWSLAIEEQFYLVWPWLLWAGLIWVAHRRARPEKRRSALDLASSPLERENEDFAELELAFASAGAADGGDAGGAGLRLLGPAPRSRRFLVRAMAPGALTSTDSVAVPSPQVRERTFSGADLLALGNLLSGRTARGSALVARAPAAPSLGDQFSGDRFSGDTFSGDRFSGDRFSGDRSLGPRSLGPRGTAARSPGFQPVGAQRPAPGTTGRTTRWHLWPLAAVSVVLAVVSAVEMAVLYHPSFDPSRIYDGTDTRAFALLIGAALAMVWPSKGLQPHVSAGARRALDGLGLAGLIVAAVLVCSVGQYSAFLYRGGMLILSLATAAIVASAAHPASRFGRALGLRPLRWLGVRSYGAYLWHYPIIVLTTPTVTSGFSWPRAALQVGATLGLAELSWRFVESPVRHGALGRVWRELRLSPRRWAGWALSRPWRWLLAAGTPAAVTLAALSLAGVIPALQPRGLVPSGLAGGPGEGSVPLQASVPTSTVTAVSTTRARPGNKLGTSTGATGRAQAGGGSRPSTTTRPAGRPSAATGAVSVSGGHGSGRATAASSGGAASHHTRATTAASQAHQGQARQGQAHRGALPAAKVAPFELRTACKQVVDIGDSTSASLISTNYLPDPAQRLGAQYARVGVDQSIMRIEGGTSIVEALPGTEDAFQMAKALVQQGYRGCWVLALGTNDAADVYVGSNVGVTQRVKEMMSLIGDQPVLWVNAVTLVSSGPYAEAHMRRWDQALVAACPHYPNMAVFNWAATAQRSWFISDGIHYSSEGSAKRAAAIADALATAFPAGGPQGRRAGACVIDGTPRWHLPNFKY